MKINYGVGNQSTFTLTSQACFSVAIMGPEYHELVYGKKTKILTDTISGGWGGNVEVNHNETVKVYGGKMQWRGEMFLLTGKLILIINQIDTD